jgi:uncharacterized membrane protein
MASMMPARLLESTGPVVASWMDSNGVFTTIDLPGGRQASVNVISNTGYYMAGGAFEELLYPNIYVGFLHANGVFTTIQVPGASSTGVMGVNSAGEVVGSYSEPLATPEPTSLVLVAFRLTRLVAVGILRGIRTPSRRRDP